jgi:hypothetical protein
MDPTKPKYWFPAKKYGWGWGPPICWQGWLVMIIWIMLLTAGGIFIMPATAKFIAYAIFMCLPLSLICYLKGEPPRWRWGKD